MKEIIYIFLIIILLFQELSANEKKPGRWGYILHSSALSDNYLETVIPGYSVICLTGFKIVEGGSITVESPGMFNKIKRISEKNRVTLYPLISFKSASLGHGILNSDTLRRKAARAIAVFARSSGVSGVHLDFEYLPPGDAGKLGDFLYFLRKAYQGTISMAVFPPVRFPEKWSRFHDLEIISSRVDEIVLMCYDFHGTHSGPGPVTDVGWSEKNIQRVLKHMKPSSTWLGIPAYGYRWCGSRAVALSARQGVRLARDHSAVRDPSGTLRFSYKEAGKSCTAYISDSHTRLLLHKLSSRYGLAGTALWRLGFED